MKFKLRFKKVRGAYFPWPIFLRTVAIQLLILLIGLTLVGIFFSFNHFVVIGVVGFLFILGEVWAIHIFVRPMRSLLLRAENTITYERSERDTIMKSISDAILAVNIEQKPLFFNSKFSLIFPMIHKNKSSKLRDIFQDPQLISAFENALLLGRVEKIKAIKLEQASGLRYYSLSVSPFHAANKEVFGVVGVFHDVTELKEAEQIRIDFVANVSHEIRTPLTSIKGYADTLRGDLAAGRAITPELIDPIIRNCERLANITNDLLDLSTLDAKQGIEKESILLFDLTQKVFSHLQNNFEKRLQNVTWTCDCLDINGDSHRIEQVLTNLLDNASKYTPVGGHIKIRWFCEEKIVVLEVSDNGPGIAQEHVARLFERFYRVDKGRSRNLGGTGLGLAIVKHIMLGHGGTVSVTSELGKGSVFRCEFPQ